MLFDYRMVCALVALTAAWTVAAGDGRLEINQACALQGCFAGDSAGFPVTITASGSYVLTSNLQVSNASSAITSSVGSVTLDLNGFEVSGPVSCTATLDGLNRLSSVDCTGAGGIGISGVDTLFNGHVRGFNAGIVSGNLTSLTIRQVRVSENTNSAINPTGKGLILVDSTLSTNGGNGVEGQSLDSRYTVRNCLFERNGDEGLYLAQGVVTESVFYQNDEGVRSNVGGQALAVNNSFVSNRRAITGTAFRSNVFDNNVSVSGSQDLGGNICDGSPC